jgi:hypothetical protein
MKFLMTLLCLITLNGFAQNLTHLASNDDEWFEGSVFLNDNSELKGLIRFNDKTGILSYQNGAQSRSFTPRNVLAFEFLDQPQNKQRVFYSIEYDDNDNQTKRPFFFEVIKDYGDFALVSKTDPIEFKGKESLASRILSPSIPQVNVNTEDPATNTPIQLIPKSVSVYQSETVYLFDLVNSKINPIIEISTKETDRFLLDDTSTTKDKYKGRGVLKDFFGEDYDLLMDYAREKNLELDKKNDLVSLFDYYNKNIGN